MVKNKTRKRLYKSNNFTEFERSPKMTWLDFISSLGEYDNCYDFDHQRIRKGKERGLWIE